MKLPSHIAKCRSCKGTGRREGPISECDWCGGSGYRQRCLRGECLEYGCSGYGDCYISADDVARASQNYVARFFSKIADHFRSGKQPVEKHEATEI